MSNLEVLSGLAAYLVRDKLLSAELAYTAALEAKQADIPFISYLVQHAILPSDLILTHAADIFGLTTFDLSHYSLEWRHQLDMSLIQRHRVLPLQKVDDTLSLAISDPTQQGVLQAITFHTGIKLSLVLVDEGKLEKLLLFFLKSNRLTVPLTQENTVNYDEPIIHFVDSLLEHASEQRASDIHLEPLAAEYRIRYRQDGLLYTVSEMSHTLATRLITRLKVIAKLDIAERRLPQDGRFHSATLAIDIRMNCTPMLLGEKVVLRLLNLKLASFPLTEMGLTREQMPLFLRAIEQPQGLILVSGPTGSGKTVTLYSALQHLNTPEKNISTVEDPIEIQLPGVNQAAIHPKIGLDFATLLRTFLRQDPDIIMVGEIRDRETAETAMHAAQTGHLVLSTIHANNPFETLARLHTLGIAPHFLTHSLSLIVSQRLVRILCRHCKQPDLQTRGTFQAHGCDACYEGYLGRTGVYTLLPITETLTTHLSRLENMTALQQHAIQDGYMTLRESALKKVADGTTSLDEINRVIS